MKSKLFSVVIFVLCFGIKLSAQSLSYGISGGINSRNVSYGTGSLKNLNIAPNFGAFVELSYSKNFSLIPMLQYSAQGSKGGTLVSDINYNDSNFDRQVKFGQLNYLMIPVLAKFSDDLGDNSRTRIFTSFGPYVGFLLSANQILITHTGQSIYGTDTDIKTQTRNINAGIDANIGLSYDFNLSRVFIQAGGNYGIIKIQKNVANGSNYSGALAITVGYSFWIDNDFHTNDHVFPKR